MDQILEAYGGELSNSMDAIVFALASNTNDLEINLNVRQLNDLQSIIAIRNTLETKIQSKIIIQRNQESDINFNINVIQISTLYSSISIKANNVMFGIIEAQHPPIIKKQLVPIKDAYVYSKYPTFNYGSNYNLIIGNINGDNANSFLNFNIENLKNYSIINAKLVLNIQYTTNNSINLYEDHSSWDEFGITWKNQPPKNTLVSSTNVNTLSKKITFDISEFIQQKFNKQQYAYDFILNGDTINQYSIIGSKENTSSSYLEIEYFDPVFVNYGELVLPSKLIVKQNKNKDMISKININRYNDKFNILSNIIVRDPSILNSNINISHDKIKSSIIISLNRNVSIDSQINIKQYDLFELDSFIIISRPNILSNIIIKNNSDILSNMKVVQFDKSENIFNIIIRKNAFNDLETIMKIKKINEIISNMTISQLTIKSNLLIRQSSESTINGKIRVKLSNKNDIISTICISHPQIKGLIIVKAVANDKLDSNIIIQQRNYNNLFNTITICKPVIGSNIIIKQTTNTNLIININIYPTRNIDSNIEIFNFKDIFSKINIKGVLLSELNGNVLIKRFNTIDSNIIISNIRSNSLSSSIHVYKFEGYIYIM